MTPILKRFIIHLHDPRNGSVHYDLRFEDPKEKDLLHSFACPNNFLDTVDDKSVIYKTRDHGNHWLELKSYRLKTIDEGSVSILVATRKYFELIFNGKTINGRYILFKQANARRDDVWILKKKK